MKKAVEFYTQNGYRVMPLHGPAAKCQHKPIKPELDCHGQCWGKVPMIEHWPEKDFTPDDFPEGCNMAMIMGKQHDNRWLVGLDIDGELDLSPFLQLPPTLECVTARGRHLVFEVHPDAALGNWNDVLLTRSDTGYRSGFNGALDLKYARGAMTSPPSLDRNGNQYRWLEWREPAMLPHSEVNYLIRMRKQGYPNVKRYYRWSAEPNHKGLRP